MSRLNDAPRDWAVEMSAVADHADRASFLRIYDHFMPRVCLHLRGMGTPESVAEELAQEAMLRLWQNAAVYDPARSAVSTWLFRIARNLHIDRLRREAGWTSAPVEEAEAEPDRVSCTTEEFADHVELQRRIDALSPVQSRLIRMSYFEAKSHQEIASELAMPLGTVKSHLRRAFLRLQDALGAMP
jgi:RNA polymerase sigma-70 factor (ECF subfamily)